MGASSHGVRDPRDAPAYTVAEAAALARVPVSTLRAWVFGRSFPTGHGQRESRPIIEPSDRRFLSFTNVVEAHVLAALRREHGIDLANARKAVAYVKRELQVDHPLAHERFKTDGVDLFVERLERLINASRDGQVVMREIIDAHLARVEYDQHRAIRLFLLQRPNAPRVVVIDPRLAFGRPVIAGTAVPVVDLHSRWKAGEAIEELAADFGVKQEDVEEALRVVPTKAA